LNIGLHSRYARCVNEKYLPTATVKGAFGNSQTAMIYKLFYLLQRSASQF